MAKPVHVMLRVLDETRARAFYETAFGLTLAERFDFGTFALVYLRGEESPFEIELTVNYDRTEPYVLGDGYGHVAVTVASVEAEHARLAAAGLAPGPIRDFQHDGRTLARFFFISDPDGYRTEVIERGGRFL